MFLSAMNPNLDLLSSSLFSLRSPISYRGTKCPGFLKLFFSSPVNHIYVVKPLACVPNSKSFDSNSDANPGINPDFKLETSSQHQKVEVSKNENENPDTVLFPTTIPKKPRRGRKSEAAACEDLVRDSLERTFASIRHLNSETLDEYKGKIIKDRVDEESDSDSSSDEGEDESGNKKEKKVVVEEESPDWPLDADVGWGIRASQYFEQHPIKNVTGEDGVEIDWEGEIDDNWVKEINCLEWESFAFHPSPLVVLVFERYNRATDNWKVLKDLEKAIKVYWNAKDRLPPRAVKIDMNIERDLAYALKVRECPQILFLRGNKIIYREKEIRTADELVHMIAHFYYKAKKPSWISDEALIPPF